MRNESGRSVVASAIDMAVAVWLAVGFGAGCVIVIRIGLEGAALLGMPSWAWQVYGGSAAIVAGCLKSHPRLRPWGWYAGIGFALAACMVTAAGMTGDIEALGGSPFARAFRNVREVTAWLSIVVAPIFMAVAFILPVVLERSRLKQGTR